MYGASVHVCLVGVCVLYICTEQTTMKPVYSGHPGTNLKCPDYQGVLIFQVSLHVNGYFGTITKSPHYGCVPIFKGTD